LSFPTFTQAATEPVAASASIDRALSNRNWILQQSLWIKDEVYITMLNSVESSSIKLIPNIVT
jgi:hypothetical protein